MKPTAGHLVFVFVLAALGTSVCALGIADGVMAAAIVGAFFVGVAAAVVGVTVELD